MFSLILKMRRDCLVSKNASHALISTVKNGFPWQTGVAKAPYYHKHQNLSYREEYVSLRKAYVKKKKRLALLYTPETRKDHTTKLQKYKRKQTCG